MALQIFNWATLHSEFMFTEWTNARQELMFSASKPPVPVSSLLTFDARELKRESESERRKNSKERVREWVYPCPKTAIYMDHRVTVVKEWHFSSPLWSLFNAWENRVKKCHLEQKYAIGQIIWSFLLKMSKQKLETESLKPHANFHGAPNALNLLLTVELVKK